MRTQPDHATQCHSVYQATFRNRLHLLQADSLLSRLKTLHERIDATEAHVTLDLDHRRNQIVSFNLVCPAPCIPACGVNLVADMSVHATCWLEVVML